MKKDVSLVNFKRPLDISDTLEFTRIDTVRVIDNKKCCYIPFFEFYKESYKYDNPPSFIISTQSGKYVLAIIDNVDTTVSDACSGRPEEFTIMSGLQIDWYLQNDGSLDFSEVIIDIKKTEYNKLPVNNQSFKIRFANQISGKDAGEFYSISGARIGKIKSSHPFGLVIYKEPVRK